MMEFKEETSYSYIYIDAENQVHLMVPISAGGQIAIDNTCQSTAEINKFFRPGPASALASVQKYIKDIQSDISLLADFPEVGADTAKVHAIWQEKMSRLQQLQQYERLLQDPAVVNSSYAHGYPEPIKELLKRKHSGNFFPIALSTAREDSATNLAEPVFRVTRAETMGGHATSGLGHVLRTTNFPPPGQSKDKSKTAPTQKASVIIDESNMALVNEIVASRATFGLKDIAELCKEIDAVAKKKGVTISSYEVLLGCFADIESFKNASADDRIKVWFTSDLMVADNDQVSAPEVVKAILNRAHLALENKERYEVTSVFEPYIPKDGDQEKFSIAVQFFLALVNAHCYAENFFEPGLSKDAINIAGILEKNSTLQREFIQKISQAIANGTPVEEAIIGFFNDNDNYKKFKLTRPFTVEESKSIAARFGALFLTIQGSPHFDEFLLLLDNPKGAGYDHQGRICVTMRDYVANMTDLALKERYANLPKAERIFDEEKKSHVRLNHKNPTIATDLEPDAVAATSTATAEAKTVFIDSSLEEAIYQKALIKIQTATPGSASYNKDFSHLAGKERLKAALDLIGISEISDLTEEKNGYSVKLRGIAPLRFSILEYEYQRNIYLTPAMAASLYKEVDERYRDTNNPNPLEGYSNHVPIGHPQSKIRRALTLLGIRYNYIEYYPNRKGYRIDGSSFQPGLDFTADIQKIREIHTKHLPVVKITPSELKEMVDELGLVVKEGEDPIRSVMHKLGIYCQHIEVSADGGWNITLEETQRLTFEKMKSDLHGKTDLEYYKSGFIRSLPANLEFDEFNPESVVSIPVKNLDGKPMAIAPWRSIEIDGKVWFVLARKEREYDEKDQGEDIIDIQTYEAFSSGAGLVYRIWPSGKCRASYKQGRNYSIPKPSTTTSPSTSATAFKSNEVEAFFQQVLPKIAENIGLADEKAANPNAFVFGQPFNSRAAMAAAVMAQRQAGNYTNLTRAEYAMHVMAQGGRFPTRVAMIAAFQAQQQGVANVPNQNITPPPPRLAEQRKQKRLQLQQQLVEEKGIASVSLEGPDAVEAKILQPNEIFAHLQSEPPATLSQLKLLVDPKTGRSAMRDKAQWFSDQNPNPQQGKVENPQQCESRLMKQMLDQQAQVDRRPPLVKIGDLVAVCKQTQQSTPLSGPGRTTFSFLVNGDASVIPGLRCFDNAVFVGAAQGNGLEAANSFSIRNLWSYAFDHTQGPALQQTTPDAALSRLLFRKQGEMVKAWLDKYDKERKYFHYQNGYLTPKLGVELNGESKLKEAQKIMHEHGNELLANLQRVKVKGHKRLEHPDANGNLYQADGERTMTHMACFAINIGQIADTGWGTKVPTAEEQNLLHEICGDLLIQQYEAAASAAVLQSRATGRRVPLVLTAIGGGAFRNPPAVIRAAMSRVNGIVSGENVDVVLSVWISPQNEPRRQQILAEYRQVQGFERADELPQNYEMLPEITAQLQPAPTESVVENPAVAKASAALSSGPEIIPSQPEPINTVPAVEIPGSEEVIPVPMDLQQATTALVVESPTATTAPAAASSVSEVPVPTQTQSVNLSSTMTADTIVKHSQVADKPVSSRDTTEYNDQESTFISNVFSVVFYPFVALYNFFLGKTSKDSLPNVGSPSASVSTDVYPPPSLSGKVYASDHVDTHEDLHPPQDGTTPSTN